MYFEKKIVFLKKNGLFNSGKVTHIQVKISNIKYERVKQSRPQKIIAKQFIKN